MFQQVQYQTQTNTYYVSVWQFITPDLYGQTGRLSTNTTG